MSLCDHLPSFVRRFGVFDRYQLASQSLIRGGLTHDEALALAHEEAASSGHSVFVCTSVQVRVHVHVWRRLAEVTPSGDVCTVVPPGVRLPLRDGQSKHHVAMPHLPIAPRVVCFGGAPVRLPTMIEQELSWYRREIHKSPGAYVIPMTGVDLRCE